MKKILFSCLLLIGAVLLTACNLMGVSKPDTSYEGYLQLKQGLSLKNVETLLGEEIEIIPAAELEVTTNLTKEERIYQDQEEPDITYTIDFDKNEKVLTYSLRTENNQNEFLLKQSKDFTFENLESMVTIDFSNDDAEFRFSTIKEGTGPKRSELVKKLGTGVPSKLITNKNTYYLEDASYILHFDKNDQLTEVDRYSN